MYDVHVSDILVVMLACCSGRTGCSSSQTNDRIGYCDCLNNRWIRGGSGVDGERVNEKGCRRDRVSSGNVCDGDSDRFRVGLVLVTLSCGLLLLLTSSTLVFLSQIRRTDR